MNFDMYLGLETNNRRLLVVEERSKGLHLLRDYENRKNQMVRNVDCRTTGQLAEEIYTYIQAQNGYEQQESIMEEGDAIMLFRGVMLKNAKRLNYFTDEKMLNLATTREIYKKVNMIRKNGWNGNEMKVKNSRITDLKLLISEYEQKLEDDKLYDKVSLLAYVTKEMETWTDPKQTVNEIFLAEIAVLKDDMNSLSQLEENFLTQLQLFANGEKKEICIWDNKLDLDVLEVLNGKAEFFMGYGSVNEVNYVVNNIVKNGYALGDVTVIYTSAGQLPFIKAVFGGNGIAASYVTEQSLQDNGLIGLARRILAWAKDGFSEEKLEVVLASRALSVEVKDATGDTQNVIRGQNYFDHVLEARNRRVKDDVDNSFILGWGFRRNVEFIEHERKLVVTKEEKPVLKLHQALLNIFSEAGKVYDKVEPIKVYRSLLDFIETYKKIPSKDYGLGMDALNRFRTSITLEDRKLGIAEVIDFIDEVLAGATTSDSERSDTVSIMRLGSWTILERPYVYIIGLSLKDLQGNTTESPIISDNEMKEYLQGNFMPTIENLAEKKEQDLLRTLSTFHGEQIAFGYSSYDTIGFCESSPSTFYRAALQKAMGISLEQITEFVYGNPDDFEEYTVPASLTLRDSFDIKRNTSNSIIEKFLDCPKKYAYEVVLHLPENEIIKRDYGIWLSPLHYGTFFHRVGQRYVDAKLIKPSAEDYDLKVDEALLETIISEVKAEMLKKVPVPFEELAEYEAKALEKVCITFFQELHDKLTTGTDQWRIVLTEKHFDDIPFTVQAYDGKDYSFNFHGDIDRIDYRIDASKQKIYLRAVDYKTGSKENKVSDDDSGRVIQHAIYAKALSTDLFLNDIKEAILALESDSAVAGYNIEFETFLYMFPKEKPENSSYEVKAEDVEQVNLTRLKLGLTVMLEEKTYPDRLDLAEKVRVYETSYAAKDSNLSILKGKMVKKGKLSDDEKKSCNYCSYRDLCIRRKAGAF